MSVTKDSIKPLVDRIVSQPLHFSKAKNQDQVMIDPRSYIVIGERRNGTVESKKSRNESGVSDSSGAGEPGLSGVAAERKPRSFQEALQLYTVGSSSTKPKKRQMKNQDISDDEYTASSSDEEEDITTASAKAGQSLSSSSDEFYEAHEHAAGTSTAAGVDWQPALAGSPDEEDIGEDIGEEVGGDSVHSSRESSVGVVEADQGSSSDEEYNPEGDNGSIEESDVCMAAGERRKMPEMESESDDEYELASSGSIQSERQQLQQEVDEHAAEEAKSVLPADADKLHGEHDAQVSLQKLTVPELELATSPTPPTTLSDTGEFYQFSENDHDRGTNAPHRIKKNWGPALATSRPKGLLNHGVTCYQNAAVQAMLHIPALQHYLFDIAQGKYKDVISPSSVSQVLAETSKRMWSLENGKSKASYINPKKLIGRLEDINCMMSVWNQEDSHEYFMSLISRLQEDSVPRGHKMTESLIYDIFGGLLQQRVKCKSCGSVSITEQPIYDLSLHLKGKKLAKGDDSTVDDSITGDVKNSAAPSGSTDGAELPKRRYSIEKSIRDFFNPELIKKVDNKEGYVCEKCKATTNAIKRNMILRAPETLLVHLKKFRFNGTSSSKMKQAVSYPLFMDLTEYCVEAAKCLPVKYQLISVVVHEGRSLSSGHYIAHCKQPDGTWATYDDEYINKITERNVLKEVNAYYLVYTRLTPKSVKLTEKMDSHAHDLKNSSAAARATHTAQDLVPSRKKKFKKSKKRRLNK
ncbi:ABL145Wp [Eremothecium gossypii ATCC 10895]|uniref:ubiquitinyl hydrolase 1 n=1 Tax=Eremothecium gossypii (strain ATCC 10895 / CBS 109.51 / FGSC 9923 / NRRL Y-1056) TaxID=284811 RepID=Q75E18_EREGS|nr:ABL145Wp [Eremothecium gossypii ATCC 10895]AAS50626.1 ABL145Wp [Eremothecium gossypii ATCC 10895]